MVLTESGLYAFNEEKPVIIKAAVCRVHRAVLGDFSADLSGSYFVGEKSEAQ